MGRQSHPVVTKLRGGIVSFARNCSTWPFECIGAGCPLKIKITRRWLRHCEVIEAPAGDGYQPSVATPSLVFRWYARSYVAIFSSLFLALVVVVVSVFHLLCSTPFHSRGTRNVGVERRAPVLRLTTICYENCINERQTRGWTASPPQSEGESLLLEKIMKKDFRDCIRESILTRSCRHFPLIRII